MDVLQQVNTARLVSAVSASHVLAYGSLSNIKVAAGIIDRDVPVLYFHLITVGPVLNTGLFGPVSPWCRLLMEENSSIRADFFSFFFFCSCTGKPLYNATQGISDGAVCNWSSCCTVHDSMSRFHPLG